MKLFYTPQLIRKRINESEAASAKPQQKYVRIRNIDLEKKAFSKSLEKLDKENVPQKVKTTIHRLILTRLGEFFNDEKLCAVGIARSAGTNKRPWIPATACQTQLLRQRSSYKSATELKDDFGRHVRSCFCW
jgi:hypothetical protein